MANMTILEAAKHFGISKEAIHNRIRRGSLEVVVIDGVKFVDVDATITPKPKTQAKKFTQSNDDKYYKLLEEQNIQLQTKVEKLEDETRSLRDQKEDMLIQERIRIEQIYKEKDEQLKSILGAISSQFMLNTPISHPQVEQQELGLVEAEIELEDKEEPKKEPKDKLISLKKYLKENKISAKKQNKIKDKFKKIAKKDKRVITINKKYYMNLTKYDYGDLLPK
ncbi:MAG: DNA-binding protein [Campylobacterota bacterium]|nr:DNA-binding protein [Campylobacterota bacterium]